MTETTQVIAAKAVVVGDRVYNSKAYHSTASWPVVKAVRTEATHVVIDAGVFSLWLHPEEGIAVLREPEAEVGVNRREDKAGVRGVIPALLNRFIGREAP